MVYNIARVDILVFGTRFDDRGKCGFGRHDGVIDESVRVFFPLIHNMNMLCSNLIYFRQQKILV